MFIYMHHYLTLFAGMLDTSISYEDTMDPKGISYGLERYSKFSRDPERTPMQWNNSVHAGNFNSNSKLSYFFKRLYMN